MPRSADTAAVHYDNVTRSWCHIMGDDFHYGYFAAPRVPLATATRGLTQLMLRYADIGPRHRVLDVGCGVGAPGLHLVETVGCSVVGISTSEVGLNIARERARRRGLAGRIEFENRDAANTELPSQSFDRVWIMESAHLVCNKRALLDECARLLRPGGRMVLCDVILHKEISILEALRHANEFDLLRRVFGRATLSTLGQLRDMTEAANLRIAAVVDISEKTLPTIRRWSTNTRRHERQIVRLLGRRGFEQFLEACDILTRFWHEQILGYGVLCARKTRRSV